MTTLNKPEIHPVESLPLLSSEPDHWRALLNVIELSPQQAKILDLLLRGMDDNEIAPIVGIPQSTLRSHIAHIFARTGSNDRTELATHVLALSHQLKPDEGEAIFYGKRLL
jgi:DNA-binding NarL/FixJ family response regulator